MKELNKQVMDMLDLRQSWRQIWGPHFEMVLHTPSGGILAGLVQCVTLGHENIRFLVSVDDLFLMFEYCNNMV